jgi:glutathione S-transferase
LKLYYFNIPGKGEAIRLACAYGEVPLEDVRMHANEFHDLKVSGKLPFGQVPALSVDEDIMLFQSAAIMRYVGKLAGLYPTNDDLYAAKIDMAVDSEIDLFMGLSVSRYRGEDIFYFQPRSFRALAHNLLLTTDVSAIVNRESAFCLHFPVHCCYYLQQNVTVSGLWMSLTSPPCACP